MRLILQGRVQSEELSHTVYGSICMKLNTKVKLLILLEAIKVKLLNINDTHEYSSCDGVSTVRRPRTYMSPWHFFTV